MDNNLVEKLAEQLYLHYSYSSLNDDDWLNNKEYWRIKAASIISGMEGADRKLELVSKKPETGHKLLTKGRPFTIKI